MNYRTVSPQTPAYINLLRVRRTSVYFYKQHMRGTKALLPCLTIHQTIEWLLAKLFRMNGKIMNTCWEWREHWAKFKIPLATSGRNGPEFLQKYHYTHPDNLMDSFYFLQKMKSICFSSRIFILFLFPLSQVPNLRLWVWLLKG